MPSAEGDVGINDIYISADDPVIRPPGLRNNNTADYAKFVPTYNCTVRGHCCQTLASSSFRFPLASIAESLAAFEASNCKASEALP